MSEEFNRIQDESLMKKSDYEIYLDIDNWKATKKYWKYWINRIRFDSSLCVSFFIVFFFFVVLKVFYIMGVVRYLNEAGYFGDLIYLGTFIFILVMLKKLPYELTRLLKKNRELLKNTEDFNRYMGKVRKLYDSKVEIYLPVIITIVFQIIFFLFFAPLVVSVEDVFSNPYLFIVYILYVIWSSIFVILASSGFILFIIAFRRINMLGKKGFPLNITFANLKSGVIDDIGKFVLKISIPSILISTFYGIMGLYRILVLNDIFGYGFIGLSLLATFIIVLLLYKNTIHVHNSIVLFKQNLKLQLLHNIELAEKTEDLSQRYQTIYNINNYFDRINEISDWPFNPKSLRKLLITVVTSVVPLVLSLFGII